MMLERLIAPDNFQDTRASIVNTFFIFKKFLLTSGGLDIEISTENERQAHTVGKKI